MTIISVRSHTYAEVLSRNIDKNGDFVQTGEGKSGLRDNTLIN